MHACFSVAAALLALAFGGCADTPERAGDRFMDRYFVEIDQARARPYTSGLATQKLDDELALVTEIRRRYTADEAKPTVYYERLAATRTDDPAHARARYELRIRQGADETRRIVLLTLERAAGRWTVSNFVVQEPPQQPPPAPSAK
jgi:hypothetical protein